MEVVPILRHEALTPEEQLLALLSRLYFVENKTQKKIKDDPEVRALYNRTLPVSRQTESQTISQATVNRFLRRARDQGVVSISVDASFSVKAVRELELSRRLREKFHLQECFALRPEGVGESGPSFGGDTDEDRLILSIVNYTAEEISSAFNPGDHVLCAGGRTICWLARAVRRVPPPKRGLIFTPLSGRLWVEDFKTGDADIIERPLDADDAVHIFAEAFENEPGGQFSQINQPLYCAGKTKDAVAAARSILTTHCGIGDGDSWNLGLPNANRALVGIGSLASSSHRLAIFLRKLEAGVKAAEESYLRAAGDNLLAINNLCEQASLPLPGDIGNRLFPCLPLPSEVKASGPDLDHWLGRVAGPLEKIARQIEELNAKAVVMSWNHLRKTPLTRVISTGRSKRRALFTVLLAAYMDAENGATPLVNELSTDYETAHELLLELAIIEGDQALRSWYKTQLSAFGLSV